MSLGSSGSKRNIGVSKLEVPLMSILCLSSALPPCSRTPLSKPINSQTSSILFSATREAQLLCLASNMLHDVFHEFLQALQLAVFQNFRVLNKWCSFSPGLGWNTCFVACRVSVAYRCCCPSPNHAHPRKTWAPVVPLIHTLRRWLWPPANIPAYSTSDAVQSHATITKPPRPRYFEATLMPFACIP